MVVTGGSELLRRWRVKDAAEAASMLGRQCERACHTRRKRIETDNGLESCEEPKLREADEVRRGVGKWKEGRKSKLSPCLKTYLFAWLGVQLLPLLLSAADAADRLFWSLGLLLYSGRTVLRNSTSGVVV